MNPFLEIPINKFVFSPDGKDNKTVVTTARIRPGDIAFYEDEPGKGCVVVMKSGQSLGTPLSFADFDQYLFTFYEYTRKNVGKFGNLVVNIPKPADKVALKKDIDVGKGEPAEWPKLAAVPKEETPLQTENN